MPHATPTDPLAAPLITDDIARFWHAVDAAPAASLAASLDTHYLRPATPGLRDFLACRISSADALASTIAQRPRFYAAIRPVTLALSAQLPPIRAALAAFRAHYPQASFPPVYFLIGRLTSGGTVSDNGLLIGSELFCRAPNVPLDELNDWERAVIWPPDALPTIVVHELVHIQPPPLSAPPTLLVQCVREGTADFVAALVTGSAPAGPHYPYGYAHEAGLWREFQQEMHGTALDRWLYSGNASVDRPADLGYFIGYRIAEAYYGRAVNKQSALAALLETTDYERLLAESGYPTA